MPDDPSPLVIAIDSSTTATKALIVDGAGSVLATGKAPLSLSNPLPGFYEQDPSEWWATTQAAISEALTELSPTELKRIGAIGITQQRETFALFDSAGDPIRPGILWLDERAHAQIDKYGTQRVREISGKPASTAASLYKLAWLAENEAENLQAADHISDVSGYLTWKLTGEWVMGAGSADTLSMFDVAKGTWAPELLEIAGVNIDQLPRVCEPGAFAGTLRAELADEWGLSRDVVVVGGCGDGQAAALGTAALDPRVAYLNLGTAVVAGVAAAKYTPGDVYRTYRGGIPGEFVQEVVQHSGAYLTTWFREQFGPDYLQGAPDPELEAAAAQIPVGSDGLLTLPYWNAVQSPHWDSTARGAMVGWEGTHTKAHMYRSIIEGIMMEMRGNLDGIESVTGVPIELVRAVGGGAKSPTWLQIAADVLSVPIEVPTEEELSAMGAAILAHAHIFGRPIQSVAESFYTPARTISPVPENQERYSQILPLQKEIYPLLMPLFARLNDLR